MTGLPIGQLGSLGPRLGSLWSRIGSLLAQRGTQAIVAGLVVGIGGGSALVVTGLSPFGKGQIPANLALLACPGSGGVLANVPTGASLLVTGRSSDGHWLEVYLGEPGVDRAWA